jgi:hypothetical protein
MICAAIVVAALSAAAGANSANEMNMTYTGCVVSVNHDGAFFLTHVNEVGHKAMKDNMNTDHTAPARLALAGRDLKKHVGQQVTVTGPVSTSTMATMSGDFKTLAIGSLKVVAKSCPKE